MTIQPVLWAILSLCAMSQLSAGPITYNVSVNTASITGTAGSLDFNFNPGPLTTQAASLQISSLVTNGTLVGSPESTGDVTGALPATLTFDNATGFNDYFQDFTFGSTLMFQLSLYGPALTSPDGTSTSGSTFAFSMFSDSAGSIPTLTSDTTDGFAFLVNVNLDGTTTVTNYSPQTTVAAQASGTVPEPRLSSLIAIGLSLICFSLATRKRKLQQNLAICLTLLSLGSASIARADFLDVRMFNQANYNQTAAGESFQGYTFEIDAITQSAAGFNSATATYPGIASPVTLSQSPGDPTLFATNYGPYASLSALHNDLPFGNYTVSFTNGTITNSATIDYTADYFQAAIPELTSASFSALQSANPSQAVTLNFNTFTPDPAANSSVGTFLTIYAPNGSVAFSTMVAADVGSVTVPAGTLLGNTSYLLTLDQGGRLDTGANGMGVNTELGFSINDNVDFTTNAAPAPEPCVFGLSVAGLGTILGIVKRRRRERTRAVNFV